MRTYRDVSYDEYCLAVPGAAGEDDIVLVSREANIGRSTGDYVIVKKGLLSQTHNVVPWKSVHPTNGTIFYRPFYRAVPADFETEYPHERVDMIFHLLPTRHVCRLEEWRTAR